MDTNTDIDTDTKGGLISIVVAIGRNREIGKSNELLWHIPDDLKRFRSLTRGHPIIMGRKTFESILSYTGKPLPDRKNIVVTRDSRWTHESVLVAHSVESALTMAKEHDPDEAFVIGGAQIYTEALPFTDRLYLTLIDDDKEGDAYFPEYAQEFTKKTGEESREWNGIRYRWLDLER